MRRRTAASATLLLAALFPAATPAVPAYSATHVAEQTRTGYAELLLPHGTVRQARAAIADYARGIDVNRHDLYFLKVQRTEHASRYVCRARWYRDTASWRRHATGVAPHNWPHLAINCPTKG